MRHPGAPALDQRGWLRSSVENITTSLAQQAWRAGASTCRTAYPPLDWRRPSFARATHRGRGGGTDVATKKSADPKASASEVVVERLQAALVDLIDLALQGKQAHWNIQGPHFRSVHLQLDEVIADVRSWADVVAERLATIGAAPDGRAATVASDSQVEDLEGGVIGTDKAIRQFDDRLQAASDRIKDSLEALEADLLSQDLLIGVANGLEKHAWMFRSAEG
ncbi:MAG: DNA starvation/stationary phase protection protein [Actinomycetales bacterium]|nr:DNA starvation/stationary phase protection protein [Actinomycetales bacterium]